MWYYIISIGITLIVAIVGGVWVYDRGYNHAIEDFLLIMKEKPEAFQEDPRYVDVFRSMGLTVKVERHE